MNLSTLTARTLSFVFSLYLILGNLPRLISVSDLAHNLLITEALLYAALLCSLLFLRPSSQALLALTFASLAIFASCIYGSFLHGFNFTAFVHAVRLCCLLWAGIQLGQLFFRYFPTREAALDFLVRTYLFVLLLSFPIYLFFSASANLWLFLKTLGIHFAGDPHVGRLITVYFDPNFYSVIGILPFLASLTLLKQTGKKKYALYCCLFVLSILLTFSRSGSITFACVALYACRDRVKYRQFLLHRGDLTLLALVGIGALCALIINGEEFFYFCARFLSFADDPSALARWVTFNEGITLFKAHPLLGIGYNYIHLAHCILDSSVLMFLVCFGLLPTAIGGCLGLMFLLRQSPRSDLYKTCVFYLLFIIFFTSHFNNILNYQFWLLPFLALMRFLSLDAERSRCAQSAPL